MIETDPNDKRRVPQPCKLPRLHLECMWVLLGSRQTLHFQAVAAYRFGQGFQVGRSRYDPDLFLRQASSWRRQQKRGKHQRKRPHMDRATQDFLVKIDLGIMQCTPLRTSTTWETRQSPTIDTKP